MKKIVAIIAMLLLFTGTAFGSDPTSSPIDQEAPQITLVDDQADDAECPAMSELPTDELSIAQGGCCKICRAGKACGNTCINRNYNCSRPSGCACNG